MNDTVPKRNRIPHPLWLLLAGLAMILGSAGLAIGVRHQRLETVARRIQDLGGNAAIVPDGPVWLRQWVGDEYLWMFRRLKRVDLSDTPATDADLDKLAAYDTLQTLYLLGETQVTTAGVERLRAQLPDLLIMRRGQAFLGIGGTTEASGFTIQFVNSQSAAERAGLQFGDVLQRIDGQPIRDLDSLIRLITSHQPGDVVHIELLRGSAPLVVDAALGSWE